MFAGMFDSMLWRLYLISNVLIEDAQDSKNICQKTKKPVHRLVLLVTKSLFRIITTLVMLFING